LLLYQLSGKTTDRLLKEAHELSDIPSERELDVLLSTGEQVSISKLSILLNEMGYKAVSLTGWQAGIFTNNVNQSATIKCIDTSRILNELSDRKIVIVAGFQGIDEQLNITTLGRGGSDTTAVALAAALKAKHCYIFSDVDGVYTTDPNKVSSAKKLDSLSYIEMLDISNEGAKVLHNRCIEIGQKFKIPIETKSTFNNKTGSIVTENIEEKSVKSIVKNDDILLVNMKSKRNEVVEVSDIYNSLVNNNILPVQFINNSYDFLDVSVLIKTNNLTKLNKLLDDSLDVVDYDITNITRIAIVGYGITTDNSIISKILKTFESVSSDVYCIDITNTKIIITFSRCIENDFLEKLHEVLF